MSAFGWTRNGIPEKISVMVQSMTKELDNVDWIRKVAEIVKKKLISAADMVAVLNDNNSSMMKLENAIMGIRWLFHMGRCENIVPDSFADCLIKYGNILDKCMYHLDVLA